MRVAQLTAYAVRLPLRKEIRHASATRRASENLLVCCQLEDGTEGWGEGVPRSYVTGETIDGAFAQLEASSLLEQFDRPCGNWSEVITLCDELRLAEMVDDARGCHGNAVRCAVELSLLDAFGKLFGEPVHRVTSLYEPARPVRAHHARVQYSTTITAESPGKERWSALKMRLYGFAHCKVKVGVTGANDAQRLRRIRRWIGSRVDLRVDANEAWHPEQLAERVAELVPCGISCIEQPVAHEHVAALGDYRDQINVPIMLDESLTSFEDAQAAVRDRTCDLFNIRLSKCGGFLRSLQLAGFAAEQGLGYQLGCHPGESPILSAAGRHWAGSVAGIRYLEGSYDRHLLATRLTSEDLTFGYGGWAPTLNRPGLGVSIVRPVLEQHVFRTATFRAKERLRR